MIFKGARFYYLDVDLTVGKDYDIGEDGWFGDDRGDMRCASSYEWELEQSPQPRRTATEVKEDGLMKADRFNEGKPQLSYMLDAPNAMEGLARVFAEGAKKYDRDNWKKGLDRLELVDCLLRHLQKAQRGLVLDDETGQDHLYHVLWNALVLAEQYGEIGNDGSN